MCSFTVSSSRTALQEQMNSYETKILFSCKYPSVIKHPGNKNDREMYEVQAELFPEQCFPQWLLTPGLWWDKDQARGALGWSKWWS